MASASAATQCVKSLRLYSKRILRQFKGQLSLRLKSLLFIIRQCGLAQSRQTEGYRSAPGQEVPRAGRVHFRPGCGRRAQSRKQGPQPAAFRCQHPVRAHP